MGKKVLGKGLDALISGALGSEIAKESIQYIKIEDLIPNRFQPRKSFDNEKINELAQSIKENGLIQPIVVRSDNDKYEVIVGERRVRAAKRAHLSEIPAVIKDYSEEKLIELALIENIQREDINPIEEGLAYKMILERDRITQEELSKRIGKSRSYIANMLRILELSKIIQDNVSRGTISVGQAKALLAINNKSEQEDLAKRIISENITVRELEGITRRKSVPRGTKGKEKDPFIDEIEEKLRVKFGTKVIIDYHEGKGSIKIEFYSNDELDRILGTMG
ncbi:Stage 0 sporulation protein J [subsurface metagenome]